MNVAVTGATGFLGRYIVNHLTTTGHDCRCWYRPDSDRGGFTHPHHIQWVPGELNDDASADAILESADAVLHAALYRPGKRFRGGEGELVTFAEANVVGTVRLIEAARRAGVPRFVFISTCAVHEVILDDRPLDEAHPLWPNSHYGAHKAAVEKFIHAYGFGQQYDICALRPTGIYGLARPAQDSKWYALVHAVKNGDATPDDHGGKEVHADDVAKACEILLTADGIAGQAYNCYDLYVADRDVASIAQRILGNTGAIPNPNAGPRHHIDTTKLRALGMKFGGKPRLEETVKQLLES